MLNAISWPIRSLDRRTAIITACRTNASASPINSSRSTQSKKSSAW